MRFVMRTFKTENGFLVECQRRFGDNFAFHRFFHDFTSKLGDDIVAAKFSQALPSPPPLDDVFVINCEDDKAALALTLDSLCGMGLSHNMDVAEQAVHALSNLCLDHAVKSQMISSHRKQLTDVLAQWISRTENSELSRCVATLLCSLSCDTQIQDSLAQHFLDDIFTVFQHGKLLETQRRIALALKNVSAHHSALLFKDSYLDALWSAASSPDAQLRTTAASVLHRVNSS